MINDECAVGCTPEPRSGTSSRNGVPAYKAGAKVVGSGEGLEGFLKFVGRDLGAVRVRVRRVRGNFRPRRKPPSFSGQCLAVSPENEFWFFRAKEQEPENIPFSI